MAAIMAGASWLRKGRTLESPARKLFRVALRSRSVRPWNSANGVPDLLVSDSGNEEFAFGGNGDKTFVEP